MLMLEKSRFEYCDEHSTKPLDDLSNDRLEEITMLMSPKIGLGV